MRFILTVFAGLTLIACGRGVETIAEDTLPLPKVTSAKPKTPTVQKMATQTIATKPVLNSAVNGKKYYKKCVACHRPDGAGIPGNFPSLNKNIDTLASSEAGRAYLVLVVSNGLRGKLVTGSGSFNGVMVRQAGGKSSTDIADMLNYVLTSFYPKTDIAKFTATEVQTINDANGRMKGQDVLALRPKSE